MDSDSQKSKPKTSVQPWTDINERGITNQENKTINQISPIK